MEVIFFMSRYMMCPICGHRMSRVIDAFGWDGETYRCEYCYGEWDGVTPTYECQRCGGDFPNCKDGCSIILGITGGAFNGL